MIFHHSPNTIHKCLSPEKVIFLSFRIPHKIKPGYDDEFFIQFEKKLIYEVFLHDRNFFLINYNAIGLPTLYKKLNPNTSEIVYYQFSLTEHEELNTPEDPCNEDKNYIYGSCIKQFITDKVGCRSRWDVCRNDDVDYCTTREEYRWAYYKMNFNLNKTTLINSN